MLRHASDKLQMIFYYKLNLILGWLRCGASAWFYRSCFPGLWCWNELLPCKWFCRFLHKRGAFVFLLWHRSHAVCSDDVSFLIFAHITPSVSKSSIHRINGLQRIIAFYLLPVWTNNVGSTSWQIGNSAYSRGHISGKANCMPFGFGDSRKIAISAIV